MSYFSFTCITPLDISVPSTFIVFSPAAPGEMVAGNEPELTLHIEYDYSKRCTEPLRQRGSFLGACQPNIRLPSIGKPGVRFWILQSNAKFVFGFHLREIRPQGGFQFRNPNPDFMDFLLTVRLGNPKKDLQNCSREQRSFFANYACACKTAVFKDSQFQSLFGFPNRTVERKSKNRFLSVEIRFWISLFIANPKSGF